MKKPIDIDALVAAAVPARENPQLAFSMPVRVDSETNAREAWRTKWTRKRKQRAETEYCWGESCKRWGRFKVSLPCVVRLTRIGPKALDSDNLGESFKAIRDQIAYQIGADDGDERIKWEYYQVPVGKRVYSVRVEVY